MAISQPKEHFINSGTENFGVLTAVPGSLLLACCLRASGVLLRRAGVLIMSHSHAGLFVGAVAPNIWLLRGGGVLLRMTSAPRASRRNYNVWLAVRFMINI